MRMTDEKALDICRRAIRALQLKYSHTPEDMSSVSEAVEYIAESVYEISEIETMIQAIEKQIPKKPKSTSGEIVCPRCATLVGSAPYCRYCGQRLNQERGA